MSGPGGDRRVLEGIFAPPAGQQQPQRQEEAVVDVRATPATAAASAGGGLRPVTIYVPREVGQRLRETARRRETTLTDTVIEAINAHLAEIPNYTGAVSAGITGSLMPRPAGARRRRRDGRMRDRSDFQIRLDGNQLAWLDHQVAQAGAGSRSAFVTIALQLHLGLPV